MSSFGGDLSTSFQYSASEEERINSELEAYMDNLLSENCPGTPPTGLGMEILQHLHDKNVCSLISFLTDDDTRGFCGHCRSDIRLHRISDLHCPHLRSTS